ncbi:hypothetical protein L226DRAFT_319078 [Lentinus tigrinus ALCF2SS1-7]|uniref:uncharacterized protein n=1 Tax=Lentinus tigrinus ALCF2SS1-7 TaxID=1328758 RepID=UPI0011661B16|nr:hypothetical protein L226DRAFT_319078 [Lentinus tigrinus ALCF2SS1-7]
MRTRGYGLQALSLSDVTLRSAHRVPAVSIIVQADILGVILALYGDSDRVADCDLGNRVNVGLYPGMARNNRYEPRRLICRRASTSDPRPCLKLGFQGNPRHPRATYRPRRTTRSNEGRSLPCPSRAAVTEPVDATTRAQSLRRLPQASPIPRSND